MLINARIRVSDIAEDCRRRMIFLIDRHYDSRREFLTMLQEEHEVPYSWGEKFFSRQTPNATQSSLDRLMDALDVIEDQIRLDST